jgi:3-hydroxyacyl-CoA dehydrogenase/enoyl-CoA hydratase/3-hydroxybutyryl-CoA epimerase
MTAGQQFEARELGRLAITPECKSLVKIFFLTESSKALGRGGRKEVEHMDSVVIGAGVMGAGIAGSLAKSGLSVILKDTSDAALERGVNHIRKYLGEQRYLSDSERSFILNRIETTTRDSANLGNAKLVIEAVFEDAALKKKVIGEIARLVPHDAILASNTSSLSLTELSESVENPGRVVGMHFFNPVEKMPLVEIIRGNNTSDKTTVMVAALTAKLGKFPIVVQDVPGFLVNRILSPYLMEAGLLISDGYNIATIDRAATRFGMPMGPVRLLDEVGLDVAAHVSDIMVRGYGDRMRGPGHVKKLVELGRLGKKKGAGFYNFNDDKSEAEPRLKEMLGITISKPDTEIDQIQERLILRLVNEAVLCLDEGVAGQAGPEAADQVDLGTVMGIGFPPFRGGVLHYADSLGARKIYERLSDLHTKFGMRFEPAPGIQKRAESGKNFHQAI